MERGTLLTADDVQRAVGNDGDNVHDGTVGALSSGYLTQSFDEHARLLIENGYKVMENFKVKRRHEKLPSRAPFGSF